MVAELRINVNSVMRDLDVALGVLTETHIVSRFRKIFKGKGLDFEDFREYVSSDDASEIDWKASKRANRLLIRQFREERDMDVFFMVDVSNSMLFGSTEKLKHEYAAELVAALSHFVLRSGDKIGLVLFTDKVVKFLPTGKSKNHHYVLLKHLLTPRFYGGGFKISAALNFLKRTTGDKCLVFLISDFIGMERGWEKTVKDVSGKFDGVAVIVRDPRDQRLPPESGRVVVSDPYSAKEMLIDCADKARLGFESYVAEEERRLKEVFNSARWDCLEISTKEGFILPVLKFLKRRELLFR
ncbi:MAG: DUF58 domain-containing protein [Candidatus Aenigmarchaeota archaeon]|nr:DUF58 domain-containing protein [Candidatus Aenigmarchaeota archaeon]